MVNNGLKKRGKATEKVGDVNVASNNKWTNNQNPYQRSIYWMFLIMAIHALKKYFCLIN